MSEKKVTTGSFEKIPPKKSNTAKIDAIPKKSMSKTSTIKIDAVKNQSRGETRKIDISKTSGGRDGVRLSSVVKVTRQKKEENKLADFVYSRLENGLAGKLFTSYRTGSLTKVSKIQARPVKAVTGRISKACSFVSKKINSSLIISSSESAVKSLLALRLRVVGTFLATFGLYTMMFFFAKNFLFSDVKGVFELLFGLSMLLLSLPLVFSDETLSGALCNSAVGSAIKSITGIPADSMKVQGSVGRLNYAFILGVAAGSLAYVTSPIKVISSILFLIFVWMIAIRPEFGVVLVSFLVPFANTSLVLAFILLSAFFFLVKTVRGKRYAVFESVDAAVAALLFVILLGGVGFFSGGSFRSAAVYGTLLLSYFLTVNLIKSRAWLNRMTAALVLGFSFAGAVCVLGKIGDFSVGGVSNVFADLSGGALSNVLRGENIEVFSRISVMVFPVALSFFMRYAEGSNKVYAAIASALVIYPALTDGFSISTVAATVGMMLLLMIYSKKAVYLLVGGLALLGSSVYIFPSFFSKMSVYMDKSFQGVSETGFDVWRAAFKIIGDFFLGGIGFGNEAWSAVYPQYALEGTDGAKQAFSLYLGFFAQSGAFGFIILLIFIVLFAACVFTGISMLSKASTHPALGNSGIKVNSPDSLDDFKNRKQGGSFEKMSVLSYCRSGIIGAAAPFCGVAAACLLGVFDNIWLEESSFLVFWLTAALACAYVRTMRAEVADITASYEKSAERTHHMDCDIR